MIEKVFWGVLLIAPAPLVVNHVLWMWRLEQYRYIPALFLATVLLFVLKWNWVLRLPSSRFAIVTIVLATCLFLPLATWQFSPWIGTFAWVLNLGAFFHSQLEQRKGFDRSSDRNSKPTSSLIRLWPLTWLMLPLPMNLDQTLTANMQLQSSNLSSYMLDLFGVPHHLLGNIIELPESRLFVEEACSGVQSLFTLVFCAFLIVIALGRSVFSLPFYALAAVFWAALMNLCRIVSIAVVQSRYGVDLSHGWKHDALGYFCLAFAVAMLLSTDRLLRVVFFPTKNTTESNPNFNPIIDLWNKLFWLESIDVNSHSGSTRSSKERSASRSSVRAVLCVVTLGILGTLFFIQLQMVGSQWMRSDIAKINSNPRFLELPQSLAGNAIPDFVQIDYEQVHGDISLPMGENGDVWKGTIHAIPCTLAMNQPYPSWHDLIICYAGSGNTLNDRRLISVDDSGEKWDCVEARFLSAEKSYIYLWFSGFDENGEPVAAADASLINRLKSTLSRGSESLMQPGSSKVAMVQLLVASDSILPPDVVAEFQQAHFQSRRFLRQVAKDGKSSKPSKNSTVENSQDK